MFVPILLFACQKSQINTELKYENNGGKISKEVIPISVVSDTTIWGNFGHQIRILNIGGCEYISYTISNLNQHNLIHKANCTNSIHIYNK
jgi:hypothetical protein